ncbi:hypothetical protein [Pseudofrankia sp. DC12]|uniref:hypothetical protein n=1 Tax=Pseudofrankia sp. DC12 TaxID=683315 RepID=UPI0005F87CDF|nr:hypothetical protein [Pseudofrankia sp. DC12]
MQRGAAQRRARGGQDVAGGGGISGQVRRDTELALARHLARRPEFVAAAAQQYLRVAADAVHAVDERRRMGALFRRAAVEAVVLGDFALAERFLTATLTAGTRRPSSP